MKTKLRICFLAPANSVHSYRWIKYFADGGHEIHWLSLTPPTMGTADHVKLYLGNGRLSGKWRALQVIVNALVFKKLLRRINPDIVHAHSVGVHGVVGAWLGYHPFVLTAWGSDILSSGKSKLKQSVVRMALMKADLVTCDAYHMRESMIKMGVDGCKIAIVYFGTDTDKFGPGKGSQRLKKVLEIEGRPTIISLRSLYPVYDIASLIQSVPDVVRAVPEAKFVIIGTGPEETKLKTLAESLRVLNSIGFLGAIPNDELPELLGVADIYVSTALSDAGLAASTAEAMACELPVIVTDSGENRRWVEDGVNGFVVPIKNSRSLGERIICLIKDRDLRERFGKINRTIIEERNNLSKEMAAVEDLYGALTESSVSGSIRSEEDRGKIEK